MRFSEQELQLFSDASGDRNPLHMSASYASRTAYGQLVVFGALGALECLGQLHPPEGQRVARLTADFHRPIFLDIDYQVTTAMRGESQTVRLIDGTVPLLTLAADYEPEQNLQPTPSQTEAHFERVEPVEWKTSAISAGLNVSGHYRANSGMLAELCGRLGFRAEPLVAEVLAWSSYLIGMELPGRSALFFRLDLKFETNSVSAGPLEYEARVVGFKAPIAQLKISASLSSEGRLLASGHLLSFIRPDLRAEIHSNTVEAGATVSKALGDKVALVIGGSRGLGAALTGALAREGAHVIAVSRSAKAEDLAAYPAGARTRIRVEAGDAADRDWLSNLRDQIWAAHGRLDFLVCNAFPPIPALRLELNALSRIEEYVSRATALVLNPLCAFLKLLNESGGCAVIISSIAVEQPVREWPHYVAAKSAIEALARIAPLQYPRMSALIVRPDRLLTEMSNTPMGRRNALPPAEMAGQIVNRLRDHPTAAGMTELLRGSMGKHI